MLEMKKWKPITIDYESVENEISNFKSLFKSGTFQEQRQILEDNIESITVNQDKKMSLKINPQGPLSFLDSDLLHYSCRRGDSNPHRMSPTTPSRWRVYQFHHFGILIFFY